MKTPIRRAALLCAILLATVPALAAAADDGFELAVTVDDLPVHGPLPRGLTRAAIARAFAGTLRAHGVPEAFGFVNARGLADEPDSDAALAAWRAAGYPLGNHTYGHLGLSQAPSLAAWIDDAARNEAALAARMDGADWRWLRYPFLDAGNGERHDGALAWLHRHGYRIADVTLGFDDWAYSTPYARCLDKGDDAAIAAMQAGFLRRVDQQVARSKALSRRVYGRAVPQVLLMHIGAWSAATLPQVMARLDAAGARYVTLARAQADSAYRDGGPRSGNGALMERRARELGVDTAGLPEVEPVAPLDGVCR